MDLVFRAPRLPDLGETIVGHQFVHIAGGKGANQAVAAARQGEAIALIACIGNDSYGQQSLNNLRADGILTHFITTINHVMTGVAGIFVDDLGNNSIVVMPGANAQLTPEHINIAKHIISNANLLICQCEVPLATVTAAIQHAVDRGVKVLFNPAPAGPLPDELLAKVTYLVLNEIEATQLSGIRITDVASAQAAASRLLARGAACVLLTLGEQGVCVARKIRQKIQYNHLPAVKVNVIDTTAAGDTFIGAFAAAIVRGLSILDAVNEAQYSAALTVTKLGAQSSIPHREEVVRLMSGAE
jgi:ribokinase